MHSPFPWRQPLQSQSWIKLKIWKLRSVLQSQQKSILSKQANSNKNQPGVSIWHEMKRKSNFPYFLNIFCYHSFYFIYFFVGQETCLKCPQNLILVWKESSFKRKCFLKLFYFSFPWNWIENRKFYFFDWNSGKLFDFGFDLNFLVLWYFSDHYKVLFLLLKL